MPNISITDDHHLRAELDTFKGINHYTHRSMLNIDELYTAYGFDLDTDGHLITEPHYDDIVKTGLPSNYTPTAGYAFPRSTPTDGLYYVALIDGATRRIYKTSRGGTPSWTDKSGAGISAATAGEDWFAELNGIVYWCSSDGVNGLLVADYNAGPTAPSTSSSFGASIKIDDGATGVAWYPRHLVQHLDRLYAVSTGEASQSRLRFSVVGNAYTQANWPANNFEDVKPYDGTGIHALISTNNYLYIFKGAATYAYYGRSQDAWTLLSINSSKGAISAKTAWKSYTDNSIYILDRDNSVYKVTGTTVTEVSASLGRLRYVGTGFNTAAADDFYEHYRLGPVRPSPVGWGQADYSGVHQEDVAGTSNSGYNINTRTGGTTQSAQWDGADSSFLVTWYDNNFGRIFRASKVIAGSGVLKYLDLSQYPLSRFHLASEPTHIIETGDLDFGYPNQLKELIQLQMTMHNTLGSTGANTPTYNVFFRTDGGSWNLLYYNDRRGSASNVSFPADSLPHRARQPNARKFFRLGLRIEFDNTSGPAGGEGVILDSVLMHLYLDDEDSGP